MRLNSRCSGNCHARFWLLWSGMVRQDDNPSLDSRLINIRSAEGEGTSEGTSRDHLRLSETAGAPSFALLRRVGCATVDRAS
jgi:hypothetical protein